jgi:hypothetical protein
MNPCTILNYFLDRRITVSRRLNHTIAACPQQIYSGILIFFNLLTLVVLLRLPTRGIKYQVGIID